ncbi:MAG: hypothetical protein LBS88_10195, partial [Tannerellaceae bacterium]|nr:hypothetical protein [Tannerellaceae bacterium]
PLSRRVQFKWSQIQWISIVLARYEAIHFRRHCEVRSNPGCARSGLLHPPGFAMTARNDDATI